jgi:senataxin
MYQPNLVRVGLNIHPTVSSVCIESLLNTRIAQMDLKEKSISRSVDIKDHRLNIIEDACIVCATLSYSGSDVFSQIKKPFEVLVVDEASQAVEPSLLVPMCHGIKQAYLVGDPSQLPATVISSSAVKQGYNMGLFSRMMRAAYPVQKLNIQYRMHPLIREFPSATFYGGSLQDAFNTKNITIRPWHTKRFLGPIAFYDICGKEQNAYGTTSIIKRSEAYFVITLYMYLVSNYLDLRNSKQIGIISPYKGQVKLIRQLLLEVFGNSGVVQDSVDLNTLDGFQGREKDFVIFSTVRSSMDKNIGFVADERRLNVGLTRSRSSIVILGHVRSLIRNSTWQSLIEHCKNRGKLFRFHKGSSKGVEKELIHFHRKIKNLLYCNDESDFGLEDHKNLKKRVKLEDSHSSSRAYVF